MTETTAVTIKEVSGEVVQGFNLPDSKTLKGKLDAIQHFQSLVQSSLIKDMDYGLIPGIAKPTLYQPGAEKIAKLLELAEYYEIISETEDWDKGFFYYKIKCVLKLIGTDVVISTGLGSANSKEPKWAYRWVWPNEVPSHMDKTKMVTRRTKKNGLQYRMDNTEIYEIVNTILKMGKKRAFIDAVKSAGRLSNLFTQDVEDITTIEAVPEDAETIDGEELPDLGNCPECGSPLIQRDGKFGTFIACSGYPKCQYKPPKPGKDTIPAKKQPETANGGDSAEDIDWSLASQKAFLNEMVRISREKGMLPADVKEFLNKLFNVPDSRSVTLAMRKDVLDKLNGLNFEPK